MQEKYERIVVTSTKEFTTPPVDLGADNCAMFELWLLASSASGTLSVSLEAGNDGVVFPTVLTHCTTTTAPAYVSRPHATVVPYGKVRLRGTLTSGTDILDAALRT